MGAVTTLLDVASAAGVSPVAATRILHGGRYSIRISTEKVQHLRKLADEMAYLPEHSVLESHRRRSQSILFAMPAHLRIATESQYFATIFEGATTAAFDSGYTLSVAPVGKNTDVARIAMDGRHDGVLWVMVDDVFASWDCHHPIDVPVVALHGVPGFVPRDAHCYSCDNTSGMEMAVEHLVKLGHRKIAFVSKKSEQRREFTLRESALLAALTERGLTPHPTVLLDEGARTHRWRNLTEHGLTAVVCANEAIAGAVLRAASDEALWLPDQLSVIGFDSTSFCNTTVPPLTAVYQPLYKMAYAAVLALIETSAGFQTLHSQHRVFTCDLHVRESTAPPLQL